MTDTLHVLLAHHLKTLKLPLPARVRQGGAPVCRRGRRLDAQRRPAGDEVAAANGARLMQTFERTRWADGKVYTWLRVRRQTGRGEGSSGLGFDELVNVPRKK